MAFGNDREASRSSEKPGESPKWSPVEFRETLTPAQKSLIDQALGRINYLEKAPTAISRMPESQSVNTQGTLFKLPKTTKETEIDLREEIKPTIQSSTP